MTRGYLRSPRWIKERSGKVHPLDGLVRLYVHTGETVYLHTRGGSRGLRTGLCYRVYQRCPWSEATEDGGEGWPSCLSVHAPYCVMYIVEASSKASKKQESECVRLFRATSALVSQLRNMPH